MTFELWMLAGAIVLGLLQIVASAHAASLQRAGIAGRRRRAAAR
jgi:hypothetical protein